MENTVNIADLKTSGTNVDGQELRDFGNGMTEFDPLANGFEPEPEPVKKSDIERALEQCDDIVERKREEVDKFNDLIDQYGGEITEEELRAELGQEYITKALDDGVGGKFEDNPGENVDVSKTKEELEEEKDQANVDAQPSELDQLEQELEYDDSEDEVPTEAVPEPPSTPNPVMEKSKDINKVVVIDTNETHEKIQNIVRPSEPVTTANKVLNNVNESAPVEKKDNTDDLSDEDKDLAALEDDNEAPVDNFEEKLKIELEKKMRPVTKKYDLSKAVVVNKPVTVTNMLSGTTSINKKIFTWALMRSKRPITVKSFSATELNVLSSAMRNNNRSADVFKTIWEHLTGPSKGTDFHVWCKCTSYYDIDHIWFAIYGACYQDSNYLPFNCTACNNLTVTNDIPIYDMCKFTKPEYKDELNRILDMPEEPHMGEVFAEYRSQISDTIVVGFREPSIYDSIIVPTLLDSEFTQKYDDVIGVAAYIANIYQVKEVNGQVTLNPISLKVFQRNEVKTIKARIIQFAKVIRSLSSDQYNIMMSYINHMAEEDNITYGLPATTCDHCHKELPEERNAAADLVFMRHRLAILGA